MATPALILSALLGAAQGGFGAFQEGRAEQARRDAAAMQRRRLQGIIENLRSPNYADVGMAGSRAFTEASDQATANAASRGVRGGARDASQDRVLASAIAQLAQFRAQDQAQRESQIGQILQNDAFGTPAGDVNLLGDSALGALLGGAGGASQALGTILNDPNLLAMLLGGGEEGEQAEASAPRMGGPGAGMGLRSMNRSSMGTSDRGAARTAQGRNQGGDGTGMSFQAPSGGGGGGFGLPAPPRPQFSGTGALEPAIFNALTRARNISTQRG